jgi:hypothetical protein
MSKLHHINKKIKQSQHIDQTAQIFELLTGVSFHTMNCPPKKRNPAQVGARFAHR